MKKRRPAPGGFSLLGKRFRDYAKLRTDEQRDAWSRHHDALRAAKGSQHKLRIARERFRRGEGPQIGS